MLYSEEGVGGNLYLAVQSLILPPQYINCNLPLIIVRLLHVIGRRSVFRDWVFHSREMTLKVRRGGDGKNDRWESSGCTCTIWRLRHILGACLRTEAGRSGLKNLLTTTFYTVVHVITVLCRSVRMRVTDFHRSRAALEPLLKPMSYPLSLECSDG